MSQIAQICGKMLFLDDFIQITTSRLGKSNILENRLQGSIGEELVTAFAHKKMGYKDTNFEQKYHGFDRIFRDRDNKLVIVESKATKTSGISALGKDQGTSQSVERIAKKMCNSTSSYYSVENKKIGEEILRVGVKNLRFLVAHVDMRSQSVDVLEIFL